VHIETGKQPDRRFRQVQAGADLIILDQNMIAKPFTMQEVLARMMRM
jgi:hypothetical protein